MSFLKFTETIDHYDGKLDLDHFIRDPIQYMTVSRMPSFFVDVEIMDHSVKTGIRVQYYFGNKPLDFISMNDVEQHNFILSNPHQITDLISGKYIYDGDSIITNSVVKSIHTTDYRSTTVWRNINKIEVEAYVKSSPKKRGDSAENRYYGRISDYYR